MTTTIAAPPTAAPTPDVVYVFVFPCGCPRTVVRGAEDEAAAWHEAAPLRAEKKMLHLEHVTVRRVTVDEYQATYEPMMSQRCPHPRDGR